MKNIMLLIIMIITFSMNFYTFANDTCDINNDGKVNVTEAVYALQVSAGIKNSNNDIYNYSLDAKDGNPKEAIYVDNNGHVGVGTNSPSANIDITGKLTKKLSGYVGVPAGSKVVTGVGTKFYSELKTGDSVLIYNEIFIVSEIKSNENLILNTSHKQGAVNVSVYTDIDLFSVKNGASNEVFKINKTGYIGIGTNNPEVTLHVNGDVKLGDPLYFDSTDLKDAEPDSADKSFAKDPNCTIGVIRGALFEATSTDIQGSICCCLNGTRGHGWFCWH